jgi:lipopolysaccharide biosynthesis glycosyltransferase
MKRINIMTSCDNNLVKVLLPQLVSIERNLSQYNVHFYLAHCRVIPKNLKIIKDFAESRANITFHETKVVNSSFYESFVIDGGRQWPREAYFTLRLQDYLPEDVDRILYIDAGDVIIDGDITPYYFDEFEGKSIIATCLRFKTNPTTKEKELCTADDILTVARGSLFNSGSYVINVEKFRRGGYTEDDYKYLHKVLKESVKPGETPFFGDQGFLAAAFVGDIKFFNYPKYKDPSYMPYNFRSSYWGLFKHKPTYKPVILHYALISKPWVVRFDDDIINTVIADPQFVGNQLATAIPPIAYMTPQHLNYVKFGGNTQKKHPYMRRSTLKQGLRQKVG